MENLKGIVKKVLRCCVVGVLFGFNIIAEEANYKRIGVLQTVEHPALIKTKEGIYDELKEQGLIEEDSKNWFYESAQGNAALGVQIGQKFLSKKIDLMVGIGTLSSQSLKSVSQGKTPIVFTSVTDPKNAGLENSTNITGVSNFLPIKEQLEIMIEIMPELKRLGIIYNPSEANAVKILSELKKEAKNLNIEIVEASAYRTMDVMSAAQGIVKKVDAIFISNDNTALTAFSVIAKVGVKNKIPVFVSDTDLIDEGAFVALGPNQYKLGRQTGKMIARILKGEVKAEEIIIEYPESMEVLYNEKIGREIEREIREETKEVVRKG